MNRSASGWTGPDQDRPHVLVSYQSLSHRTSPQIILFAAPRCLTCYSFFSRKTQSEVLCEICGLLLGGRSRLLWLVSRDTACWRPAPPLVLYSAGTLPVWARARGTSSTSQRRPRIHRAAGWTSCSPDPPGGPIRRQQFKVRPIKSWTHSGSIQILLFQ